MLKALKVLTDVEVKQPGFFTKTAEWIKTNPILFSLGIGLVCLTVGLVIVANKKQNKRKKRKK